MKNRKKSRLNSIIDLLVAQIKSSHKEQRAMMSAAYAEAAAVLKNRLSATPRRKKEGLHQFSSY